MPGVVKSPTRAAFQARPALQPTQPPHRRHASPGDDSDAPQRRPQLGEGVRRGGEQPRVVGIGDDERQRAVEVGCQQHLPRPDSRSLEELAQTPILNRGGQVIRVSDVATVEIGRAPRLGSASSNGRETVVGTALMLQGENSLAVAHRVGERLKEIGASLPPGVVARPALDRTQLVEATIRTVEHNLALGARRAKAAQDFLAARGVASTRIRTISYGKERPVALCDQDSCWAQNRRAVTVLNTGG